jgi:PAS domain S-box-containing protein
LIVSHEDVLPPGHPVLLAAIENSANAIVITDREGVIEYVNPAFSDLTGYSRSEAIGKNPRIQKSDAHPPQFYGELWRTILSGQPWRGQVRNRRKDGSEYVEEMTITPVRHQGSAISHFVAIKEDITGRYEADQELKASRERLELGLEVSRQGLCEWNLVSGNSYLTSGFRQLLGYEEGDAEAGLCGGFGLIHPDDRAAAEHCLQDHLEGRVDKYEAEVRLRMKNGDYLRVLSRGKVLSRDDSGNPVRMIVIHSDISERAKLEQQLRHAQKMEAFGLFASGVAHDFNNMLTVMNGYSELLLSDDRVAGEMREFLERIRASGDRAATLTRRLLTFSRRRAHDPKIINLNDVVADLINLLQRLIPENIRLTTRLESSPGLVLADPSAMQQALMNLALNARDAMPRGGNLAIETANLELHASFSRSHLNMPTGSYVVLAVTDTGVGMDDSTQEHLFEPFYTTKPVGLGTGLGLSTVYAIVKQSGGWISVHSEKGQGTSFKIYLPAAAGETVVGAPAERVIPEGGYEAILVVEDSAEVRGFIRTVLQGLGYTVVEAADGNEAITAAKTRAFDLLVADIVLPDTTGPRLAAQMAEIVPGIATLYISGYTHRFASPEEAAEPAAEFLQKPFTGDELGRGIRQVLRKRKPMRILFVDDDPAVAQFSTRVLSDAGYDVVIAEQGKQAMSIVEAQTIDLVIMDLFMPEQEGLETIAALHKLKPSLPIIAISGMSSGVYLNIALTFGARATIEKPYSVAMLLSVVRQALGLGPVVQ